MSMSSTYQEGEGKSGQGGGKLRLPERWVACQGHPASENQG